MYVSAEAALQEALCPHCGAIVPPNAVAAAGAGAERHALRAEKRHHDVTASWLISGALHAAVLTVLVLVAWPTRAGPREADFERTVRVLIGDDEPPLQAGSFGPERSEPLAGELAVPQLANPSPVEPIRDVSARSDGAGRAERVFGIEVAGGAEVPGAGKGDWTDFAAGAGGTGGGGASFFGLEARGQKFVFVVDRSGSMNGPQLDAAKAELIRAVHRLERGAKFYTIFFNTKHKSMPAKGLVRATETNKRKHFAWVRGVVAGGSTDPTSAMRLALSLEPDVIWLLSDGKFRPHVAAVIRESNPRQRIQIHTIAFYSRQGEKTLREIAEANRGRYRYVSPESMGLGRR